MKLTLVLLPGMDGTGHLFESFIAALEGEFRVIRVSYPNTGALGYGELESIARATLPDGPYILVGESFSGPIAISLAAAPAPHLRGLVLCCSFARNPRQAFSGLRFLVGMVPMKLAPVAVLGRLLLGRFSTRALRLALARSLTQLSASALRARLQAVLGVDVSSQLSAVKVPVLYLRASQDLLVPPSASELVAMLNPRTEIVEIEAPHFLLQAAPTEAARAVSAFARKTGQVSPPRMTP
jgi:pimeloyl-ACP methyl ester carboxylesterase